MVTDRARLGRTLGLDDRPAVATLPAVLVDPHPHFARFDVLDKLAVARFVLRLDFGIALHAPYDTGKSGYYNLPNFGKGFAWHFAIGYPF